MARTFLPQAHTSCRASCQVGCGCKRYDMSARVTSGGQAVHSTTVGGPPVSSPMDWSLQSGLGYGIIPS